MSAHRMTPVLEGYLRAAGMPDHFTTVHSFCVGDSVSKVLTGTVVDETMKIGGRET